MNLRKPVRVRKARRRTTCPLCRCVILPGARIASISGGPWTCAAYITDVPAAVAGRTKEENNDGQPERD